MRSSLEHMLDRSLMPETALKQILATYFDSLLSGNHHNPPSNGHNGKP